MSPGKDKFDDSKTGSNRRDRDDDDNRNDHDLNDDHGQHHNSNGDGGHSIDDGNHGDSNSGNHKAFKFEIANGQVTEVYELKDGTLKAKSLDDHGRKTYAVDGNDVIRTEIKPFGTEITRYSDVDGDGIYLRVSEQWQVSSNFNGTAPKFTETINYGHTSGDDHIAVRSGENCRGGYGADDFIVREAAHLRIEDFSSHEGDLLVFDTGLGLTSKDQLASYVSNTSHEGQNLIVNFGSGVSITIIGVQADQISWNDVSVLS